MTVSMETIRMAKSRPRKNQSERSDLLCHIIIWNNSNINKQEHNFLQTVVPK